MAKSFLQAVSQFPLSLAQPFQLIPQEIAQHIYEIRIRKNRPVVLRTKQGNFILSRNGSLSKNEKIPFFVTKEMMEECFHAFCGYSLHTTQEQVNQGFVTLKGGHRVGLCGTMSEVSQGKNCIRDITSANVRIARQIFCDIPAMLHEIPKKGILIVSEPSGGKTTFLRTLAHQWSRLGACISIMDERKELFFEKEQLPLHCDIFSSYPKHIAIQHALRGFSPDLILCDEIGTKEDVQAVLQAVNAGVVFVATLHASSYETLKQRRIYQNLIETQAFEQVILLKGKSDPGQVAEVHHVEFYS